MTVVWKYQIIHSDPVDIAYFWNKIWITENKCDTCIYLCMHVLGILPYKPSYRFWLHISYFQLVHSSEFVMRLKFSVCITFGTTYDLTEKNPSFSLFLFLALILSTRTEQIYQYNWNNSSVINDDGLLIVLHLNVHVTSMNGYNYKVNVLYPLKLRVHLWRRIRQHLFLFMWFAFRNFVKTSNLRDYLFKPVISIKNVRH